MKYPTAFRHVVRGVASLALVGAWLGACSDSSSVTPNTAPDSGPSTGPGPLEVINVSGSVSPASGLLARELDVTLTLKDGEIAPKPTLDFGKGITVTEIKNATATSLTAHVRVESDAPLGKHDARVILGTKALVVASAFEVFPTVDLKIEGSKSQGGVAKLTLTNRDTTPFDKDFELDDLGEGFYFFNGSSNGTTATVSMLIAPKAPVGKLRIVGGNKSGLAYYADPDAFDLSASTLIQPASAKGLSLSSPLDTKAFRIDLPAGGANGAIYSLTMSVAASSALKEAELLFYGSKGTFSEIFADVYTPSDPGGAVDANGDPLPQAPPYDIALTIPVAAGAPASEKYLQILPQIGTGAFDLTVTQLSANKPAKEVATAHATAASAQDLGIVPAASAGGVVVSGELASASEWDVYSFTAAKGDLFEIAVQGVPEAEVWLANSALGATDVDPIFAYASNTALGGASGTTPYAIATADLDAKKKLYLVVVPYANAAVKTGGYTVSVRRL